MTNSSNPPAGVTRIDPRELKRLVEAIPNLNATSWSLASQPCRSREMRHRYSESEVYDYHQDRMVGNKRWIYVEVEVTEQAI